jgi:hypothetical protein
VHGHIADSVRDHEPGPGGRRSGRGGGRCGSPARSRQWHDQRIPAGRMTWTRFSAPTPAVTFSHGWPLSADARDGQLLFLAQQGFRVVAHGSKRSCQRRCVRPDRNWSTIRHGRLPWRRWRRNICKTVSNGRIPALQADEYLGSGNKCQPILLQRPARRHHRAYPGPV